MTRRMTDTEFRRGQTDGFDLADAAVEDAERELRWSQETMGETTNAVLAVVRAKLRAIRESVDAEWSR